MPQTPQQAPVRGDASRALACGALLSLIAAGTAAQTTRQVALGLAREPFAVTYDAEEGHAVLGGRSATSLSFARVWFVGAGFSVEEVLLEGPADSTLAEVRAISSDARYYAGRTNVQAGPLLRAALWRAGQWREPQLPPPPDGTSQAVANAVDDFGGLVGTADGAFPFFWDESGGARFLAPPPGGLDFGRAEWIAPQGDAAAGAMLEAGGNDRAVHWRRFDAPAVRLADPFGVESVAFGGSADGRNFAGDVADAGGLRAAIWLDGQLRLLLDPSGLPLSGSARGVGVDRTAWGVGEFDGVQRAFLWNPVWGDEARPFADWFVESGGTAEPETWIEATDLARASGRYHVALRATSGGYYADVPEVPTTPWEVGGVRFDPAKDLTWDAQSADSQFDVLAGDLDALVAAGGALDDAACLASVDAEPTLAAGALGVDPEPGAMRWFLLRARNPRGEGSWDGDYSGVVRAGAPGACP